MPSTVLKAMFSGAFNAFAIKIIGAGLAILIQVLLARSMGTTDYGIYALAMIWVIIGGQVGSLGFCDAATRFLAQYGEGRQNGLANGFLKTSRMIVLGGTLSFSLLSIGALLAFESHIGPAYTAPLIIAFAMIPLMAYQDLLEGKSFAFSWVGIALGPGYVIRQGLNFVILILFVVLGAELSAETALGIAFVSTAVSVFVQQLLFSKSIGNIFEPANSEWDWPTWRATVIPLFYRQTFFVLARYLDVIVIGLFLSPEIMALYFAATRLTGLMSLFQYGITAVAARRFAGIALQDDLSVLEKLVSVTTRSIFWLSLLALLGLVLLGSQLLLIFGPEFEEAYPILVILGFGILIQTSVGAAEDVLIMYGHARMVLKSQIIGIAVNFVSLFLLVPTFGAEGAAVAMALGFAATAITIETQIRSAIGISVFVGTLGQRFEGAYR